MGTPRDLTPGYRWTCRVCGKSRVTKFFEEDEEQETTFARAERALLAHVHSSIGEGHGPKDSLPDGVTAAILAEYIEPVTE